MGWYGESDKPRYEAVLASSSRAGSIEAEPLIGVAAISRSEFDGAVQALEARGLAFASGRPTEDLGAYAVVADDGGRASHASLGLDASTVTHLEALAEALERDHRGPVDDVIDQVRSLVVAT